MHNNIIGAHMQVLMYYHYIVNYLTVLVNACIAYHITTESSASSYRQSDANVRVQVVSFLFELLTFAQQNGHPWFLEEYLLAVVHSLLERVS